MPFLMQQSKVVLVVLGLATVTGMGLFEEISSQSEVYQKMTGVFEEFYGRKVETVLPKTIMLPMRDSVKMYTTYWELHKNTSTVIMRSPYGPTGTENIVYLYITAGFNVVMQNQRGTGKSEGDWAYWQKVAEDGQDTMDWIASQPWSNKVIYQAGASADGVLSYLDLKLPQKYLHGQWLIFSNSLMYYTVFQGGTAYRQELVQHWLSHMHHYRPNASSYSAFVESQEGYNNPMWAKAMLTNLSNVNFPATHLAGWNDIFLQPMLASFEDYDTKSSEGARGKQSLIVGPRGHCFFFVEPKVTFPDDTLDFVWSYEDSLTIFESELLSTSAARDVLAAANKKLDRLTLYIMGPQKHADVDDTKTKTGMYWTTLPDWPKPTPTPLYLASNGTLETQPSHAVDQDIVKFTFDPQHPVPTSGGNNLFLSCGPMDQRSTENRSDVVLFTSAPFSNDTAIVGRVVVHLNVSSNATDTDFTVKLTDVYPDGSSRLIGDQMLRMRWRINDTTPVHMQPGTFYEIDVEMWETAYIISKGHALRLAVSSSNYPRFSANRNNGGLIKDGGPYITAENVLSVGGNAAVVLPVVTADQIPANVHVLDSM